MAVPNIGEMYDGPMWFMEGSFRFQFYMDHWQREISFRLLRVITTSKAGEPPKQDWQVLLNRERHLNTDVPEFVTLPENGYKEGYKDYTGRIPVIHAQEIMDDLWRCGLRPTEGVGSAGSLKATQDHLKDMQKLVFEYFTPLKEIKRESSVSK